MDDDDFINDPIFQQLKAFSAANEGGQTMPSNIRQGFRDGIKLAKKRRFAWRGAFGAGLIIIAFPTLAAAKILPHPIQHFVESVNSAVASPVHKLIKLSSTHHVIIRNSDNKRVQKSKRNRDNFSAGIGLSVLPTQESDPSSQVSNPSEQGILNSLGKAIESAIPRIAPIGRFDGEGGRKSNHFSKNLAPTHEPRGRVENGHGHKPSK